MNQTQTDLFGSPVVPQIDFYGYLLKYAKKKRGKVFSPEEVTSAAVEDGVIEAAAMRSTGHLFTRAATEGHIKRPEPTHPNCWYRRKFGNGTKALAWVGC